MIRQRIESGQNQDTNDVIHEALQLLSARERNRAELQAALAVGLEQIERGETVPWTPDLPSNLFADVLSDVATENSASPQTTR